MKRLRFSAVMMVIAILAITGFQGYWLKNNYDREKQSLELKTNAAFRQTILRLQTQKLRLDPIHFTRDSVAITRPARTKQKDNLVLKTKTPLRKEPVITILNLIEEKMRDSLRTDSTGRRKVVMTSGFNDTLTRLIIDSLSKLGTRVRTITFPGIPSDSALPHRQMFKEIDINNVPAGVPIVNVDVRKPGKKIRSADTLTLETSKGMFIESENPGLLPPPGFGERNSVFRFLYDVDSLSAKDSVTVAEITNAYRKWMKEEKINTGFSVNRLDSSAVPPANAITVGLSKPASFTLSLNETFPYFVNRLKLPFLFSLFLVGITILSFVLLYRNMLKQQRLAELKNEFISNITHELKTPIATVGVAIEALKNFNAIDNPARTREYLDISQNELQRLNLLVDKVLKLSMFEKKEIVLKMEDVSVLDLVSEVVSSMKLQIEKFHATVNVSSQTAGYVLGDRLHLLSVVFNLLDNALKYGGNNPVINIDIIETEQEVTLNVTDNGIGIPSEYHEKVFEKFFRVPHGDTHNAKGYGLGLSYVAHVVRRHEGKISVSSPVNGGSSFTVILPKNFS